MYLFAITTLLPAAIITSVSTYRLKLHLRHGAPLPTTGCSRCGHAAALALSCLGAVVTLALMGAALNLVGPTATAFISTNVPGGTSTFPPQIAGMPGPTLAILAMFCAVLAAVLLLSTLCCTGLTALPGFGVRCKVVCDEAGQQQQQRAAAAAPAVVQFNPAGGVYAPQVVAWGVPAQQQGKEVPQFMLPVGGQGQPPPPPPPPPSPPPR